MKLFDTLNASGARYVVVGGLASLLHGVGRITVDVDIALDFATDSATYGIHALSARASNRQPTLDILLDPVVPFPELLRDAVSMDLHDTKVPVVNIAHLIQLKQHSGRAQDIADIEALRRVQQHKSGS